MQAGGQRFDSAYLHQIPSGLRALLEEFMSGPVFAPAAGWFFDNREVGNCYKLSVDSSMVKLLRACGGCLGAERR